MKKLIILVGLLIIINSANATNIPKNLWKGIIGEAVSEGYKGMYAVACVYKNRLDKGMPLGCYAMNKKNLNSFVRQQGKRYEEIAKRIIWEIFIERKEDITEGATHYENVEKFGIPYWAKGMTKIKKIGCHTFYKKRRKNVRHF